MRAAVRGSWGGLVVAAARRRKLHVKRLPPGHVCNRQAL